MQQFLRADGRPLRGDTLQQLAQLFQNILAGDSFALEDSLRLRHLLPDGDISATGCGGLLHGKRVPALFHGKRAFRPRSVNWRARHGFRRSRQERRGRRCSGAALTGRSCGAFWRSRGKRFLEGPHQLTRRRTGRTSPGRLARPLGKLFQSFQQLGRPLCRCGDHTPCLPVDKTSCRRSGDFHDGPGHIGRSAILRNGGKGRALALRPACDFRSLVAVRDAGWRLPLDARTLGRALTEERILPSLFLYFATVTAARGLRCAGGIFQTSYLPRMIRGICTALRHCGADGPATRIAGAFRPCPPCTGLLPLRLPCPDGPLRQTGRGAGAADLWLAGGLSPALWQSLRHSRVDHALAASLPYHYEDLSAQEMRPLLLDSLLQQAPPIGSLPFLAPSPLEMPHA